jgi:phosphatidylglycerol:prolipoprotein diacylglycerol transferase
MIPFLVVPDLWIGPIHVHPFGLALLVAVIAGHTTLVRRARAAGVGPPAAVETFAIVLGASALAGSFLAGAIGSPEAPLSPATAVTSSIGGFIGGAIGFAAFVAARRADPYAFADLAAYAFPFGWFFARLGCAMAHDHLGVASTSWLAVSFPAGPRFDLGLLEWLCTPGLVALVVLLARRPKRPGTIAAAVGLAYPLIRFPLDLLRTGDPRYAGLTAVQWAAIPLALLAFATLVRGVR